MVCQNSNPAHLAPELIFSQCLIALFSKKCHETESWWSFSISPYYSKSPTGFLLSGMLLSNLSHTQLQFFYLLKIKPTHIISWLKPFTAFASPVEQNLNALAQHPRASMLAGLCLLPSHTHYMVSYLLSEQAIFFCMSSFSPMLLQSLIASGKYLLFITKNPSCTKHSSEPHLLQWVRCLFLH